MEEPLAVAVIGIGATALTDLWAIVRSRVFGVPLPNYALVGRWVGHMRRGRFRHASIGAAQPVRAERSIGWITHYLIGIGFAALVPAAFGADWLQAPTPAAALAVGLATVAAPFLLMQPGMGAGIAARHTPNPGRARVHSLVMHGVFGLGLYVSAVLLQLANPA